MSSAVRLANAGAEREIAKDPERVEEREQLLIKQPVKQSRPTLERKPQQGLPIS